MSFITPLHTAGADEKNTPPDLDSVQRVEKLLSQLEATSMAMVPYRYGQVPVAVPSTSSKAVVAALLVAIWLSSLALTVAYFRYENVYHPVAERTSAVVPLAIPTAPDPQDRRVASSVDRLAKALVSSSERLDRLQSAVVQSNRDLRQLTVEVNTERAKAVSTPRKADGMKTPQPVPALIAPLAPPVSAATPITVPLAAPVGPVAAPAAPVRERSLPKNYFQVLEIKPTNAATPHKAADGNIDYWLVARSADKGPAKVLPIAVIADGVVVHDLEDGKNYTLTPQGEWRAAEW